MWKREIYTSKSRTRFSDPTSPNAELISPSKMIQEIGIAPEVMDPLMWQKPIDMPNRGGLN